MGRKRNAAQMAVEWPYVIRKRTLEIMVNAWIGNMADRGGLAAMITPFLKVDVMGKTAIRHPNLPNDHSIVMQGGIIDELVSMGYLEEQALPDPRASYISVTQAALDLFDMHKKDQADIEFRRRVDALSGTG